ncbi:hypothetical protein JTE90_005919 [Oedothorax gibbosus]|uniref:Uncharacterized protein n=1 Tax=Oedothorax gibbosus TaxID=931172 RepID=A0AAV6U907_9ARAC|nr:hypothetical protein JTE90_005919 [Oedothorax gibbosus]
MLASFPPYRNRHCRPPTVNYIHQISSICKGNKKKKRRKKTPAAHVAHPPPPPLVSCLLSIILTSSPCQLVARRGWHHPFYSEISLEIAGPLCACVWRDLVCVDLLFLGFVVKCVIF